MAKDRILTNSNWKVRGLRLTVFPTPDSQFNNPIWERLVGNAPEETNERRMVGERREEGTIENGKFIVTLNPQAIVLRYIALEKDFTETELIPIIGEFNTSLDYFLSIVNKWFEFDDVPNIKRIAFGASLVYPVQSQLDGYKELMNYLPQVDFDENTSDFLYRINRRKVLTIDQSDIQINRLSTWSVSALKNIVFALTERPSIVESSLPLYACNLELDINTSPDYDGEFSGNELSRMFINLVNLGIEIVEKGDIK